MESKQIVTIAVVAIVVIAAVAVVVSANKKDDDKSTSSVDASVLIYGNANNDWRVDNSDVEFVQSIVDGKTSWDKTANPYADANCDGSITSADVDLIKKIVGKESCTVYYQNYFGEQQAIKYPLTNNKIMVTYWQQAEAVSILGHWNEVVVASAAATTVYPDLYPSTNVETVGTTGSSTAAAQATETIIEKNVDLIIATPSTAVRSALSSIENDSSLGIQIVYLWYSGNSVIPTILTLGVLMDSTSKAEAYAQYVTDQMEKINKVVSSIPDSDKPTILAQITYTNTEERATKNGGYCFMFTEKEGAYYLLSKLGNVMSGPDESGWGYSYRNMEWLLEHDSEIDILLNCEASIGFNTGSSPSTYNERFETNAEIFNKLSCYGEGKIIGSVYAFLGGFSGSAMLPLLGYMIYPDKFTLKDAIDSLQYWFDNFTDANIDVTNIGGYYYTGTSYNIAYNRD